MLNKVEDSGDTIPNLSLAPAMYFSNMRFHSHETEVLAFDSVSLPHTLTHPPCWMMKPASSSSRKRRPRSNSVVRDWPLLCKAWSSTKGTTTWQRGETGGGVVKGATGGRDVMMVATNYTHLVPASLCVCREIQRNLSEALVVQRPATHAHRHH